jgi:hypothetical protein
VRITDLLTVTVSIPPREIERFLDALAQLPYSINPNLRYEEWQTHIQFPAWRVWLDDLHAVLAAGNFHSARLRYTPAVDGVGKANV